MDHLIVKLGGRRVLVADVCASADGHGVGYGIILKRIDKVLWYAQATNLAVFFIREASSINTTVFRLQCDAVEILPRRGLEALTLRCIWYATAPFRLGSPGLWARRMASRLLLGRLYAAVERSRRVPAFVRRFVVRPRPLYQTLRRANSDHAARSVAAWNERVKVETFRRRRERPRDETFTRRFSLPPATEKEAVALAERMGIGASARVVTVHVRESGYRATAGLRQREWDELRNARIESYFDAFSALVERGYTVVRLGDPTMTPVSMPGVVDLATVTTRSESLEAWCVMRSEFLIGCDSGPSWLAFLLDVPILTVNALHFRDVLHPRDRMICKRVRERATGRVLALDEMLTPAFMRDGLRTDLYEHIDNTPRDIAEAALDMADVVAGTTKLVKQQRIVNKLLESVGRQLPHDWSGLEGIAITRRPRGALSRKFAKRYLSSTAAAPSGSPGKMDR
jgi:putative glycosyltransferase (TIGR04372 family)